MRITDLKSIEKTIETVLGYRFSGRPKAKMCVPFLFVIAPLTIRFYGKELQMELD